MNIKNIYDQTNDKGQFFLARLLGKESDNLLKLATEVSNVTKLASNKFAWADFRKFPVDNQDNAILSKIYFDAQKDKIPSIYHTKIASVLNTYLDLYNVPESIFDTVGAPSVEKVAEVTEDKYLLPKQGMCKIASSDDLSRASLAFSKEYNKLKISDRVEFSKNFMKYATELKFRAPISIQIVKYAAMLDTNMDSVKDLLRIRVAAANRQGKSGSEYKKLASLLEGEVEASKEELEKLAEVIQVIDEEYGFDHPKYDRMMPDAYGVVFNKEAMDLTDGAAAAQDQMDKATIVGRYGEGVLSAVEKDDGSIDYDKLKALIARFHLDKTETETDNNNRYILNTNLMYNNTLY